MAAVKALFALACVAAVSIGLLPVPGGVRQGLVACSLLRTDGR